MNPVPPCPVCGRAGFGDLRALRAHERVHQTVECPDCGRVVGAHGIGPHRKTHGVTASKASLARVVSLRALQLRKILAGLADTAVVDELAAFVVHEAPAGRDLYVVLAAGERPRMCGRVMVGQVVAGLDKPAVVVRLDWLPELTDSTTAIGGTA